MLVHGSWVDHRSWDRLAPLLARALRVVVYDRRGHGASRGPPRARPVHDDAADLARLLESIDLYPAHVIAHSYGGAVALRLAIDRPELVRSVALHEPPFLGLLEDGGPGAPEARAARAEVRRIQAEVRAGDRAGAARAFVERFSPDPGGWERLEPQVRDRFSSNAERWAEEIDDPEAMRPDRSELGGLDLPVLLTTGERSGPLFHAIQAELGALLRNSTSRTLPEAGHVPHLTQPAAYAGTLGVFLLERDVPSS